MDKELILDAGDRVSPEQSSHFTYRHIPLLVQLFLEAGEHLEKLTFNGEPRLGLVGPHLWRGSWGRVFFAGFFDMNIRVEGRVDSLHALGTTDLSLAVATIAAWEAFLLEEPFSMLARLFEESLSMLCG